MTDLSEIVERGKAVSQRAHDMWMDDARHKPTGYNMDDALDILHDAVCSLDALVTEIERQASEIERLREALAKIAHWRETPLSEIRALARAALNEKESDADA